MTVKSSAGSLSASRSRAIWRAAAPRIDWSGEYGIEPVAGVDPMPQPLVAGGDVVAIVSSGTGVGLLLGDAFALPDCVVAAAVMAVSGLIGGAHPLVDDWPSVLSARGLRPFDRCSVEGCWCPTYSQKHLVVGAGLRRSASGMSRGSHVLRRRLRVSVTSGSGFGRRLCWIVVDQLGGVLGFGLRRRLFGVLAVRRCCPAGAFGGFVMFLRGAG